MWRVWGAQKERRRDLSEWSAFFLVLLHNKLAWRERLVQDLQFGNSTHLRRTSGYQIDLPPDLVAPFVDIERTEKVNVLLPLTTRRKSPLLNFGLVGPNGAPSALTSRASTAALQANYLDLLAGTAEARRAIQRSIAGELYEAISFFTPGRYERGFLSDSGGDHGYALLGYLRSGLGGSVAPAEISYRDVMRWRLSSARAAAMLLDSFEEPSDPLSSSEEVLLAIPHVDPLPRCREDIDDLVEGYRRGVEAAYRSGDKRFLDALAEYGRRYELVVEVEIPVMEPSTIKIQEDLPLSLAGRFGAWATYQVPLGDARSVHVEARVADAGAEIGGFALRDLDGGDASGWIESARHTREALALYTSDPERPYHASLRLRLTSARHVIGTALALTVANIGALLVVLMIRDGNTSAEPLAVLAIPTTVAAAVALVREQTALVTRIQWRGPRALLAVSTLVLWIAVVVSVMELRDEYGSRPPDSAEFRSAARTLDTIGRED